MKTHPHAKRAVAPAVAVLGLGVLLAACGTTQASPDTATGEAGSTTEAAATTEAAGTGGNLAVSYENGIAILDPQTLEVIEEFESEPFTRLNAVGDGQHVLVTTSEGFQVLDTTTPELTDSVFPAEVPGHVVRHAGKTVLYDDGTSDTTWFDTEALAAGGALPDTQVHEGTEAHHGVSVILADGTLVTTVGNAEGRSGATALEAHDDHFHELATSTECPGIHGEGTAADEHLVFGCENGALMFADGEFTKFTAPDEYGRMGNAYVSGTSPIVVGDYKNDPDAEGYLLEAMTLIDTAAETYEVIPTPEGMQYTYRDVVRGPDDLAYVLGTDGAIHVLDPATGEFTDAWPVVDPWEGPQEWQDPHPALTVSGDTAYVADPAKNSVHAVDLTTGDVTATVELSAAPNEMVVAIG